MSIASRVKIRSEKKIKKARVDLAIAVHKKLIIRRKKEYELKKRNNMLHKKELINII